MIKIKIFVKLIIYAVTKRTQVVMVMIIFKNAPVDDDFCLARIEKI